MKRSTAHIAAAVTALFAPAVIDGILAAPFPAFSTLHYIIGWVGGAAFARALVRATLEPRR